MQATLDYNIYPKHGDGLSEKFLLNSRGGSCAAIDASPVPYIYDFEASGYQMLLFPRFLIAIGWRTFHGRRPTQVEPRLYGTDIIYESLVQKALYVIALEMLRPLGIEDHVDICSGRELFTKISCKAFEVSEENFPDGAECAARYKERYRFKWSVTRNEFCCKEI